MRQLCQINYGDKLGHKSLGNIDIVLTSRHNTGIKNMTQSQLSP
jgi:hypothetical protein